MSSLASENLAIPQGSRVLVTGASGFIASHIVKQLLEVGYKVRGTVRDTKKSSWLLDYFNSRYGPDALELAQVSNMAADDAFAEAVKGCSGVIHTATPVMKEYDPNVAIPVVVKGTTEAIAAAAKEGIKRVVLTSSSTAASNPIPNKVFKMDPSTWNEDAVKAAWAPPPYEGTRRRLDVYGASKTEGEKAAWELVKKEGKGLVLNCVLPNANIGEVLSLEHQGWPSTSAWVKSVWTGFTGPGDEFTRNVEPQYYVNVDDNAKVHVAALIFKDVQGERLFAFAYPFNWNTFLALFRKMYPGHKFIDDLEGLGEDKSTVTNERAEELLKRLNGGKGWASLEESIKPLTDHLVAQ